MKLIYGVNDKPKFGKLVVFAIQQLLAIMAATLVVPVITGHGMSSAAALFGAGMGTLVYILFTLKRSPVFLGSSFAFLGSMASAFAGAATVELGYAGLIIGAVFAGLVYVLISLIVKIAGVNWVDKLMPAVVIGPTVAIIGLSLAGNAIGDLGSVNYSYAVENDGKYEVVETFTKAGEDDAEKYKIVSFIKADDEAKDYKVVSASVVDAQGNAVKNISATYNEETGSYDLNKKPGSSYVAIICGLITLFVTMIASCYGKKMARLIPFVIGILGGYAAACIFYIIGNATGNEALMIINFEPFKALVADGITLKTFVGLPEFTFFTAFKGISQINADYIISIAVAYVPVAFVVFAEHLADHKNISSIIEKDLLTDPGLSRTLLGDGVGSMVGAFFGGCPNTTYGESVGCVAITKNASVVTIMAAAIGAIIVSFVNPFVAFVNSIPSCVMGGVCVALYGFIAVSGLKMIKNIDLEQNKNLFVVSAILITGIGGFTLSFGAITITSIACSLIIGIVTNIIVGKAKEQ